METWKFRKHCERKWKIHWVCLTYENSRNDLQDYEWSSENKRIETFFIWILKRKAYAFDWGYEPGWSKSKRIEIEIKKWFCEPCFAWIQQS